MFELRRRILFWRNTGKTSGNGLARKFFAFSVAVTGKEPTELLALGQTKAQELAKAASHKITQAGRDEQAAQIAYADAVRVAKAQLENQIGALEKIRAEAHIAHGTAQDIQDFITLVSSTK